MTNYGWQLQNQVCYKMSTLVKKDIDKGYSLTSSIIKQASKFPKWGLQQYYADRLLLICIRKGYSK